MLLDRPRAPSDDAACAHLASRLTLFSSHGRRRPSFATFSDRSADRPSTSRRRSAARKTRSRHCGTTSSKPSRACRPQSYLHLPLELTISFDVPAGSSHRAQHAATTFAPFTATSRARPRSRSFSRSSRLSPSAGAPTRRRPSRRLTSSSRTTSSGASLMPARTSSLVRPTRSRWT